MEYEQIKQLIEDMGKSKLSSLDIEFPNGIKIKMKKNHEEAPMKSSSPHRGRMRRCGASTRRRSNGGSNPHRLTAKAKFPKRQPFMRLGMALLRSTAPRRRSVSRRPAKPLGFRGRSISPSRVILASSAPPLHAP